ncbi:MAG: CARDB domain-containing protein [Phycisphaerae bacterium]
MTQNDRAVAFLYYVVNGTPVVWPGATSQRDLSPTSFPPGSDAEVLILESMGLWNIVPGADFEFTAVRLDQDYNIDHTDGFNDTAVVASSQLDPGVLGVTFLVNNGAEWFDMDVLFSDNPDGVGYTLDPNPGCDVVANPIPTNGYSFLLIAVHEMGHALGLGHFPAGDEPPGTQWFIGTMNPGYPTGGPVGQNNIIEVHTDDRNGVRFLYPPAVPVDPPVHDVAHAGYSSSDTIGTAVPVYFSPSSLAPGDELTLRAVIENFGTADELAVREGFYLSLDPVIDELDMWIGALIWDLAAGSAAEFDAIVTLPGDMPAGDYFLGAIIDDLNEIPELYEDNNAVSYCEMLTVQQLAPVIDLSASQAAACGQPYEGPSPGLTHPVNMSPVTWTLDAAPVGVTIDADTGVITWANPVPAPTPHDVTVRATNGAGSATALVMLTVLQGDTSGNGRIDLGDLPAMAACLTGPVGGLKADCGCSDLDADTDVDLRDIWTYQTAFEN